MENEDNENENSVPLSASFIQKCKICDKLSSENSKLVSEFAVKICKVNTLGSSVKEVLEFVNVVENTEKHGNMLNVQASANSTDTLITERHVIDHLMLCIAPGEPSIRLLLCNTALMVELNRVYTTNERANIIKLLLQTQAAEKKIVSEST